MSDVVAAPTASRAQAIRAPQVQTSVLTLGGDRGCIHELATVLATLTSRKTAGAAGRYPFFAAQPEWPMAWLVRAHRAHRALTVGCADDLDIALRIFSSLQAASDPEAWCATWWIDHEALLKVAAEASDLMSLVDSVNGERDHPVDARRAEEVRTLLAASTDPVRFDPVSPGVYTATSGDAGQTEFHIAPTSLADPSAPLMAFGVLPQSPVGIIDRVVAFPGAVGSVADPAIIETVIGELPIGTIVEIEAAENGRISQLTVEGPPFTPDGRSIELGRPTSSEGFAERGILTVEPHGEGSAGGYERLIITGYELRGDRVGLVVSPTSLETPADPARHGASHGNRMTVRVDSLTALPGQTLRRLVVEPGGAVAYIHGAAGCSSTDTEFGERLREGAMIEAIALANGNGRETLAIRPVLYEQLQSAATDEDGWYRASIESLEGEIVVALDQLDEAAGVRHLFACDQELMQTLDTIDTGTEVEIELATLPLAIELPEGAHAVAESHPEVFVRDDDGFVVVAPLALEIVDQLVAAQTGDDWAETVWRWFDETYQLYPTGVRTSHPVEETPAPSPEEPPARPVERVTVAARIPDDSVARIQELVESDFAEAGIDALVSFDGSVITIDAASGPDARRAVEAVRRRALPAKGQIAIGATELGADEAAGAIEEIASTSGIGITPAGDEALTAEAETITALRQLFAAVTEQIPGAACTVTAFVDIEMIEDPGEESTDGAADPGATSLAAPETAEAESAGPEPAGDAEMLAGPQERVAPVAAGEPGASRGQETIIPAFAEAAGPPTFERAIEPATEVPIVEEEPEATDLDEPVVALTVAAGRTGGPPPRVITQPEPVSDPEPLIALTVAAGRTGGPPPRVITQPEPVSDPEPLIALTVAAGRTGGPAAMAAPPTEPAVAAARTDVTEPPGVAESDLGDPFVAAPAGHDRFVSSWSPPGEAHPHQHDDIVLDEPPPAPPPPTQVAENGPPAEPVTAPIDTPQPAVPTEPVAPPTQVTEHPPQPEPVTAPNDTPQPAVPTEPVAPPVAPPAEPGPPPEQPSRRESAPRAPDRPALRPGSLAARLRAAAAAGEGSADLPEPNAPQGGTGTAAGGEPAAMPRDDVARRLHDWWSGDGSTDRPGAEPPLRNDEPATPAASTTASPPPQTPVPPQPGAVLPPQPAPQAPAPQEPPPETHVHDQPTPPAAGTPSSPAPSVDVAPSPHSDMPPATELSDTDHPVTPAEPDAPDFTRPDIDELTAYWFGTDPVEEPKPEPSRSRAYRREPVAVEEEEPAELEGDTEDPTTLERRRMATRVILAVSGFVVVGVIVLVAAMFFTSQPPAQPAAPADDPLIVVPEAAAGGESPFAVLIPTAAAEPAACWQAVMGTFQGESAAQEGAERLGDVGLPGVVLPSESVPGWGTGSFVASVTVGSESLADLAIDRAGLAGFGEGSAVEAPVADCDASGIVTTALGLGFLDVPTSHPDSDGIAFASAAGLLEPCIAPDSGLFCPEEPATVDDIASIAATMEVASQVDSGAGTVATQLTVLAQTAGLPDPGLTPGVELTRGDLAGYLLDAHESFEG